MAYAVLDFEAGSYNRLVDDAPVSRRSLASQCVAATFCPAVYPPPTRRHLASPDYLAVLAGIWRSGLTPPLAELHQRAVAQARCPADTVLLAQDFVTGPDPAAVPEALAPLGDPLPEIVLRPSPGITWQPRN